MPIAAAIQLGLALLPLVETGVTEFIAWIASLRAAALQTGEWTDEQEAAFRASLYAKTKDPAYIPDPKV
jgi:hypothetical protein